MVDSTGEPQRPALGRSILAVVSGFIVIGALAFGTDYLVRTMVPGVFPADGRVTSVPWLLFMQGYVLAYAVFGCWLCARLAPDRPMRHALILGVLGLVFNVAGSVAQWEVAPAWYHLLAIALVMPAAWIGGALAERRRVAAPALAA